jgi:phosphatidylethanolamine/phosphatidyl-N-methylethanolamine N-methyltransferase
MQCAVAPIEEWMEPKSVLKAYARYAPVYDRTFGLLLGREGRPSAAAIANVRTGSVLEVGVGTGLTLPHYRRDHDVTGIDISPEMLAVAERRVRKLGLNHVRALREMDAGKLEFANESFDVVVAAYVMSVVPDPGVVMREIERVCRPGGDVVIVNHFAAESGIRLFVEKHLAPLADTVGWEPDFSIERVLSGATMRQLEKRALAPFGLFTLLHLRKDA